MDPESHEDRLAVQKGCYILNSWGHGPQYWYGLFIRGPYSRDLADDLEESGCGSDGTDIPEEDVERLSAIYARGMRYLEAYSVILLLKTNSPGASAESIIECAVGIKPYLEAEIMEASEEILGRPILYNNIRRRRAR